MSQFTSATYLVQSGTTTISHTPLTGATWSSVRVRWYGIDTVDAVTRYRTGSVAWHNPLLASGGYSGSYAITTCDEGGVFESTTDKSIPNSLFPVSYAVAPNAFVAGTITYKIKNMVSPAGTYTITMYIKNSSGDYINTANTAALSAYAEGYAAANFDSSLLTTSGKEFNAKNYEPNKYTANWFYSQAWYDITYDKTTYDHTTTPTVSCNDNNITYTGELTPNVWTSWITCPASFFTSGVNTIEFSIQGSLQAVFQYQYDYTIPTPIDGWTAYGELADYRSYESHPNGYATTLMAGTWPTVSGLDYGSGSIILEFKESIGKNTGITWVANEDIFQFDYDYDTSKIGTVLQSRGSKVSGPMMYSLMSDWATALTLSASVDTFLIESVAAGATMIYVMTAVPTADTDVFVLTPNSSRKETATVVCAGEDATGIWYGLDDPLTYEHYLLEEMVGTEDAKWYFTADSASDLTGWYDTMVAQYGAPEDSVLEPPWPVKVGSEIIYMYAMTASDATHLTLRGASAPYRGQYDIAYAHATGAKAFCVPTVGTYPKTGSMYDTYGAAEVTINPLSMVDTHTLDIYCWNGLMNSTTSGTTAKGIMPAVLLPATVGVGDWVTIAHD